MTARPGVNSQSYDLIQRMLVKDEVVRLLSFQYLHSQRSGYRSCCSDKASREACEIRRFSFDEDFESSQLLIQMLQMT